jgi:transmembrane sensor
MKLNTSSPQTIQNRAAQYITRLYSGELTEQEEQDIYQWLEESDAHKREYQLQLQLWESSEALVSSSHPKVHKSIGTTLFNRYTSVAAAILIATILFLVNNTPIAPAPSLVYKTNIGEVENITLSDNSTITLNTNSEIKVNLSDELRKVELVSGEAFFVVTSNKKRPFVVSSGQQEITVVGTQFNVHKLQSGIEVAVIEGIVQVAQKLNQHSKTKLSPEGNDKYLLEKGNVGTFNAATDIIVPLNNNKLARKTSWRNGLLVFKNENLQTVIHELNRYRQNKIELRGTETQTLKISGTVDFTQEAQVISGLLQTLPITLEYEDNKIILTSENNSN